MVFTNDIRYGIRRLRKSPGFTLTAILTLALGTGVTTTVFSVCDAMMWKPVPIPRLDRLAMVAQRSAVDINEWDSVSAADLADLIKGCTSFSAVTAWQDGQANIVGEDGDAERVQQYLVAANFFDLVGVQPVLGRGFQPGEDQTGHEQVVVLSNALWRRRFAEDRAVVGKTVRLDDRDFLVIGVAPRDFAFPKAAELWTPMALTPEQRNSRVERSIVAMGLLQPGRTPEQAAGEIDAVARRLAAEYPETNHNRRFRVMGAHHFLIGDYNQQYLTLLFGAVLFVLLIACTNVANLQLARATGRIREVAVRMAVGAGRRRVITQLITESILLSLGGAGLGLIVASFGIDIVKSGMPPQVEKYVTGWRTMGLDVRGLAFMFVVAIATGVISGLAPALQCSRPSLLEALKEGGRSGSAGPGKHRMRNILVGVEVALAVVLLIGASLMVRGFRTLVSGGEMLQPRSLLALQLTPTEQRYPTSQKQAAFYDQVLEKISAIPGVSAAVAASGLPYSQHWPTSVFTIEGRPADPANQPDGTYQKVSPNYFSVMHIPLRSGRLLSSGDGRNAPGVAVINQAMARRWWPGEPLPIGKRFHTGAPDEHSPWMTIVGVVADVPQDFFHRYAPPVVYIPYAQSPRLWMDIGIRTAGDPLSLAPAVVSAIHSVDPALPVNDLCTLETLRHRDGIGLTYVAAMMSVFGTIALLLAAVGVYGVMAYVVSEQTHQIGIRMALGAPRGKVLAGVFRSSLLTTGVGMAVGLAAAYELARLLGSLIFGVVATDLVSFVGIPVALAITAALAIYIPARRAMSIDPIAALRYE